MEKSDLLKRLSNGKLKIYFTKKDGTERIIVCTRNLNLIPIELHPKGEEKEIKEVIPVYDIENEGWRSFNYDSVKAIYE